MYKVFFYQHILFLGNNAENKSLFDEIVSFKSPLKLQQFLFKDIIGSAPLKIYIESSNLELLWKSFRSLFRVKTAAGGLVQNNNKQLLFIKRQGKWDLPKGHIEKGESKKKAAVREVEEECGISGLKITNPLLTTFHTYWIKGKPILKPTFWYMMNYDGENDGAPQVEEDITEIKWATNAEISKLMKNSFPSIRDVYHLAFDPNNNLPL